MSDHIHEWRLRRQLIKAPIPDQLLADWFTKYLLTPIGRDVSMGGTVRSMRILARVNSTSNYPIVAEN